MAVSDAWPLQTAVYTSVDAAVSPLSIPVLDHVPVSPPSEHVRIEGFSYDDESYKNRESGRHAFMVSYFLRPAQIEDSPIGLKRVWEVLNLIHAQVKAVTVNGRSPQIEYMDATSDNDGASQHGMLRYTIYL